MAACAQIGSPEDFVDEEDAPKASAGNAAGNRRLFRDPENGMIGGVATGMAHYFDADPVWVRVIALLIILFTGIGLPVYLVLWVITPKAETVADRMAMRGERATFENIKSRVQSEYERVENHLRDRRPGHHIGRLHSRIFPRLGEGSELVLPRTRLGIFAVVCGHAIRAGLQGLRVADRMETLSSTASTSVRSPAL